MYRIIATTSCIKMCI